MDNSKINKPPYYDDYTPEKNYIQVLPVPGRVAQSREISQIGSINRDLVGRLGSAIYKNGSIINGCTLSINEEKNRATISEGQIFLEGLVRNIKPTTIDITGRHDEVIGARIIQTIVTENEDASLRNPAQGYLGYGQEGAHRLKEEVEFVTNNSSTPTVFRLKDGALVIEASNDNTDVFTDIMARRTYEENGNYKIKGLDLRDRSEIREDKHIIALTEGKAYIEGYEVIKPFATTIPINPSLDVRSTFGEPKTYNTSSQEYLINNQPVREFTSVLCECEITVTLTRGTVSGGSEDLNPSPVIRIVSVKQTTQVGGVEKTYSQGTDYQLGTDRIEWSPLGAEPQAGTEYQVTYRYTKKMEVGKDIELIEKDGVHYLKFKDGGTKPVNSTKFTISYKFFLARKDLICLDKNGKTSIIEGKPDIEKYTETPINQNEKLLELGSVLVKPNKLGVNIINFYSTRMTQAELYSVQRRVSDIEYNQAITNLDKEAMANEPATTLKGIYTDGFIGLTKADLSHPQFNCTIDIDMAEMTLPTTSEVKELNIDDNSINTNIAKFGRVITAPYQHKLVLEQPYATDRIPVNPYSVYLPMRPIRLNPEVDSWIDTTKVVINKQETKSTTLARWWFSSSSRRSEEVSNKWKELGFTNGPNSYGERDATTTKSSLVSSEIVMDDAILYMREKDIEVSGANFPPHEDNIECYFNDTKVSITPLDGTSAGTTSGTLRANSDGSFKGKIRVIPKTPCGSVEVRLQSSRASGSATYTALGRKQTVQDTVLTTKIVVSPVDPIAETFEFESDTILTKLGLFFAAKDDTKSALIQIRNTVNGYPGQICYAEAILRTGDVQVSENASKETEVVFHQPVYCKANEQYAICVLSDSPNYELFTATLGKQDIATREFITTQPYTAGVLFSSSNAKTWTAHQDQDLKFKLYRAQYTGKGQIIFEKVTSAQMNRVVLASQSLDYKNNGIDWYYKVEDTTISGVDNPWLPIQSFIAKDLNFNVRNLSLKAEINVSDSTSPIIARDCINLVAFTEGTVATYVSRQIETDESFNNIRVFLDLALPSGSTCSVYIKTDKTSDWVKISTAPVSTTPVTHEFTRYEYRYPNSGSSLNLSKQYRIKIELSTSNPLARPRAKRLMSILKY